MISKQGLTTVIQKNILRTLLSIICDDQQLTKRFSQFASVNNIFLNDQKITKDKKIDSLHCPVCFQSFKGILLFTLHLQLGHQDELTVFRYGFEKDQLRILARTQVNQSQSFYQKELQFKILKGFLTTRVTSFLNGILAKFHRKYERTARKFYHSNQIFRQIGAQSEDQDSQQDLRNINQELEKLRISQFTDINDQDKKFFLKWNQFMKEAKKTISIVDRKNMAQFLQQFAKNIANSGIKRMSLVVHIWTLWSNGKIASEEVNNILMVYDNSKI